MLGTVAGVGGDVLAVRGPCRASRSVACVELVEGRVGDIVEQELLGMSVPQVRGALMSVDGERAWAGGGNRGTEQLVAGLTVTYSKALGGVRDARESRRIRRRQHVGAHEDGPLERLLRPVVLQPSRRGDRKTSHRLVLYTIAVIRSACRWSTVGHQPAPRGPRVALVGERVAPELEQSSPVEDPPAVRVVVVIRRRRVEHAVLVDGARDPIPHLIRRGRPAK